MSRNMRKKGVTRRLEMSGPYAVAFDSSGILDVSNNGNNRITE